jgi:hypothetical protein
MFLLLALLACGDKAPSDDTSAADTGAAGADDDGGSDDTGAGDDGAGDDGGDDTGDGAGGDSDPGDTSGGDDTDDFCADVATVTYNSFGQGFMTENCQGCHASTAPQRYGAPEEVFFDTVEDCWTWSERILARSTGDSPTMPPQGGVNEDDRTRLEWWLRCADPGT